jgi:hypothetical protein
MRCGRITCGGMRRLRALTLGEKIRIWCRNDSRIEARKGAVNLRPRPSFEERKAPLQSCISMLFGGGSKDKLQLMKH